jgi:hypothetical protein
MEETLEEKLARVLFGYVSPPKMTTTWHLWGTREMIKVVPAGHVLMEPCDELREHGELTHEQEILWSAIRSGALSNVIPSLLPRVDSRTDLILGSIHDDAGRVARFAEAGTEDHQSATRILRRCFPEGARAVTTLPMIEQLTVAQAIDRALQGPLAADVAQIGLGYWAKALHEILPQYESLILQAKQAEFNFSTLAQSRRHGRVLLNRLIVRALHHAAEHPEDTEIVVNMLDTYSRCAARYSSVRRKNKTVPALNPNTGEVTERDEDEVIEDTD